MIQSISKELVKCTNQQLLNVARLAAGEYVLSVNGRDMNERIKFTKGD